MSVNNIHEDQISINILPIYLTNTYYHNFICIKYIINYFKLLFIIILNYTIIYFIVNYFIIIILNYIIIYFILNYFIITI